MIKSTCPACRGSGLSDRPYCPSCETCSGRGVTFCPEPGDIVKIGGVDHVLGSFVTSAPTMRHCSKCDTHGACETFGFCRQETENFRLNNDKTVVVSTEVRCSKDMAKCPRGAKAYLIGQGGVGVAAVYDGDPFWVEWAPLPGRAL